MKVAGFFVGLFRLVEGSVVGDAVDDGDGSDFGSSNFRLETGCSRSSEAGIETVFLELDGGEGSESMIVIGTRRRRVLLVEGEDEPMSRGVFCDIKSMRGGKHAGYIYDHTFFIFALRSKIA